MEPILGYFWMARVQWSFVLKGNEMNGFWVKQGQGLKISAVHLYLNFPRLSLRDMSTRTYAFVKSKNLNVYLVQKTPKGG